MKSIIAHKMVRFLSTALHYVLIYLMIGTLGSNWYSYGLPSWGKIVILAIFCLVTVIKTRKIYDWFLPIFMVISTAFTRLVVGGVGLSSLLDILIPIFALISAVRYDREGFLVRFINIGCFLMLASLLLFTVQLIDNRFFQLPIFTTYLQIAVGTSGYQTFYYAHGMFLYSFVERHATQNCGIFTEPGTYQILCNSVLLIVLLFRQNIDISKRTKLFISLVAITSVLTTMSTTGYISLLLVLMLSIIAPLGKEKKRIWILLLGFGFVLLLDYMLRGFDSIISRAILNKLFTDGKLNLYADTGQYRMDMVNECIALIIKNPLGVGFDTFNSSIQKSSAGGGIFVFAAVYGLPAALVVVCWLLAPLIRDTRRIGVLICLTVFINVALAQTYIFYPTLVLPIYCFSVYSGLCEKQPGELSLRPERVENVSL